VTPTRIGSDQPTDIIWVLSIILAMRAIALILLKSRNNSRQEINRTELADLLDKYLGLLHELENRKEDIGWISSDPILNFLPDLKVSICMSKVH